MARILVVDDEPDIVRVVSRIMESCGHHVMTADDGAMAVNMVRTDRPDAVILDLMLPTMDGHQVCHALKSDEATRQIPIIMLTAAYVSVTDAKRSGHLGADEYVVKPFLREVLIGNLDRLLAPR